MKPLLYRWIKSSAILLLKRAEEFVFPPLCVLCDEPRIPDNPWFCQKCLTHILNNHQLRKSCPRCSQNTSIRSCSCDFTWEFPFQTINSFLDYDEKVQGIMQHVKYLSKRKLAFYMGELFSRYIPQETFTDTDYIIPVPLHWLRRQKRGYNQAEWFARGIVSGRNKPVLITSGLFRKKRTKTQVKLDRSDRQKNVQGAFGISDSLKDIIKQKSIALVDDVITTGATTAACTEALLLAGCSSVNILSLARD